MFAPFEKYLLGFVQISGADLERIKSVATVKKIRKWQSLLHDGEVWKSMCFVVSGCFRLYRFDQKGIDHTVRFGIENWWMTDTESFNHQTPSNYNIEALSSSTVIIWGKNDWEQLLVTISAFKQFYDRLNASAYETSQQRIFSLISGSAEERYLEFQRAYPNVFNKVPLHMVASYLGISRETLSRIRKDFSRSAKTPRLEPGRSI
ncbi:Crp/Fnr family transcriptional regulator [Pedobacter zeae]|uniref:CRP-like cAMP-binding protein n=1 Tax=Pedobacter zeae TaxID=1737356 RepID=A0A7W6KC66_9SPHI|nr:Crp/Fnr family transcriptional regulator [Pedobacter zeae]MBB4109095.1 CRP-like cAMP-binding protein [Pedobacter zeae]GGH10248.1 cyclic nucleotide-binding protein [Pedobacter zeae]